MFIYNSKSTACASALRTAMNCDHVNSPLVTSFKVLTISSQWPKIISGYQHQLHWKTTI
jgi:hypothetical protein